MKEYEARCLVERWVKEFSPFEAAVVDARPGENGSWVVVVECSTELGTPSMAAGEKKLPNDKAEQNH